MVMRVAERRQAIAGAVRESSWEEEALKGWENMHGWSREDRLESRTGMETQSGKGREFPEAEGRPRLSLEAVGSQ